MTVLETELSGGNSLVFLGAMDDRILDTIKFYARLFMKLPSQQQKIHEYTVAMFRLLKKENIKIKASFTFYNFNLSQAVKNSDISS